MDVPEVTLRAIGLLTHAREVIRSLENGEEPEASGSPVEALLEDIFTPIDVPPDATPQEVVAAVSEVVRPAVVTLVVALGLAFSELADVHDAGRTDLTSEEVLQTLALRMSQAEEPS